MIFSSKYPHFNHFPHFCLLPQVDQWDRRRPPSVWVFTKSFCGPDVWEKRMLGKRRCAGRYMIHVESNVGLVTWKFGQLISRWGARHIWRNPLAQFLFVRIQTFDYIGFLSFCSGIWELPCLDWSRHSLLVGIKNHTIWQRQPAGDAFQKFDEDGSDSIDMDELQNVIKMCLVFFLFGWMISVKWYRWLWVISDL